MTRTPPTIQAVAARLDALEAQNRRLRLGLGALALLAVLAFVWARQARAFDPATDTIEIGDAVLEEGGAGGKSPPRDIRGRVIRADILVVDRIRAREAMVTQMLEVRRPDGRAALWMDIQGAPTLTITDSAGAPSLRMTAANGRGVVYTSGEEFNR